MKDEKKAEPEGQSQIKSSVPDTSGPTEILPAENPKGARETKRHFAPEEKIMPPEMPKATLTIIRPTIVEREDSVTGRAADLMETMKDKTEEAIDSIMSATGQGVHRTVSNLDLGPLIILIIEQKSSSETKTYIEEITIEKRQVERKKNIEVEVAYDEIFVNGKEIGSSMGVTLRERKNTRDRFF